MFESLHVTVFLLALAASLVWTGCAGEVIPGVGDNESAPASDETIEHPAAIAWRK